MSEATNHLHLQLDEMLAKSQTYFERTVEVLEEEHSSLAPAEGTFTAAQSIAHVAQTVDWFMDGAFKGDDGFSMDFATLEAEVRSVTSMASAKSMIRDAFDTARSRIKNASIEQLTSPLPEGPIMGGLPRMTVVSGIQEHTAHHRGALSVYARLAGLTPKMPYGDL